MPSTLIAAHGPSFCAIVSESMEGSYCAPWLQIPSPFVHHYLQECIPEAETMKSPNKDVVLEGPSGKLWQVGICGMKVTSLGFKKGWRKFAIDHNLAQGDVLVIKMVSNTHFKVQMFGKFGIEKEICEDQEVRTYTQKRKGGEETEGDSSESCFKRLKAENLVSSLNKKEDMEKSVVLCCKGDVPENSHNFPTDSDEFVVLDEEQRMAACNLFPQDRAVKAKVESTAHSLELQNVEDLKLQKEEKPTNLYTVISKRRPVSQAEKEAALNTARAFKTNLPAFRKIMTKSNVYRGFWLGISRDFTAKYLPPETQQVALTISSGKEWTAKLLGSRVNPGLSGGWKKFALENLLEEGDVCIFELRDPKKLYFMVHIYRVVELNAESKQQKNHVAKDGGCVRGKMRGAISRSEYRSECREKLRDISSMSSPGWNAHANDHNAQSEEKGMQESKLCSIELEICHHLRHMIMEKNVKQEVLAEQQVSKPLLAIVKVKEEVDVDTMEARTHPSAPTKRPNVRDVAQVQMRSKSKGFVPEDDGTYYEVERLISRRKGKREDEFLVLLAAEACREQSSTCDKEDGGWWVPMSHFKSGFKACRL